MRKHGRSLTVMPWTTTDELNDVPKTKRMSLASFPGHKFSICLAVCVPVSGHESAGTANPNPFLFPLTIDPRAFAILSPARMYRLEQLPG